MRPRKLTIALIFALGACRSGSTCGPTHATTPLHTPQFHRDVATSCGARPATSSTASDPEMSADLAKPDHHECVVDADCTRGKNGRCFVDVQTFRGARVGAFARCSYDACVNDADCPNGVCLCRDAFGGRRENICVTATCKLDADCGSGNACSPTLRLTTGGQCRSEGQSFAELRCHTASDACSDDRDCPSGACSFSSAESRWICDANLCLPD